MNDDHMMEVYNIRTVGI